eukprot:scaffold8423_cov94-Phaeocystis_antarctica.AAC.2
MIASRAANGMNIVVVWRLTQLTDIVQTKRLTTKSPQQGCRASARVPSTLGSNPSTLEASGDALWLTTVGLRVFATVDGQEGEGCRAANLGCLTTPTAWAWSTVHAPL